MLIILGLFFLVLNFFIFIFFPCFIVYTVYSLYRKEELIKSLIYFVLLLLLPVGLVSNGFSQFLGDCDSNQIITIYETVDDIDGFIYSGKKLNTKLLAHGKYQYVETKARFDKYFYHYPKELERNRRNKDRRKTHTPAISKHHVSFNAQPYDSVLLPFNYTSNILISNTKTNEVLAQASYPVFGGGLIGRFFNLIVNQGVSDKFHFTCGYVDESVNTRERDFQSNEKYKIKDVDFITSVLKPSNKVLKERK